MFSIASCTKLVTTIAVLQLVEEGKLHLDDDVSGHLPVLGRQKILNGFRDDGSPIVVDRHSPITVRQLLTHSCGAGYAFMQEPLAKYVSHMGKSPIAGSTVVERFDHPILYEPGSGWNYGSGIAWAGKLLEVITGQSLEAYMRKHICERLGITSMTFWPEQHPDIQTRRAGMAMREEDGTLADVEGMSFLKGVTDCFGGEGAFASVEDYIKIVYSLFVDDEKLLKRETTAQMFRGQLSAASKQQLAKAMSDPSWVVGDFTGPHEFDFGLGGILVDGDAHPLRNRGYFAWSGAPNLYWVRAAFSHVRHHLTTSRQFIDRPAGLCGVFGTQVLPPADVGVEQLISAFEKEAYVRVAQT